MSNKPKTATIAKKNGIFAKKLRAIPVKEFDHPQYIRKYIFINQ